MSDHSNSDEDSGSEGGSGSSDTNGTYIDSEHIWAYEHAIALARQLLDNPAPLKLHRQRRRSRGSESSQPDLLLERLRSQTLTFEDVEDLMTLLDRHHRMQIDQWVKGRSQHDDLSDEELQDRRRDVMWMLRPLLQLEILQRREDKELAGPLGAEVEVAHADGDADAGASSSAPAHADAGVEQQAVDVVDAEQADTEADERPKCLTDFPTEVLTHIFLVRARDGDRDTRAQLSGATAFGLCSKQCSARLYEVLMQAADSPQSWECWDMIGGPNGAYSGRYMLIDWDGVDDDDVVRTDYPVVRQQLRHLFLSVLRKAILAATAHAPPVDAALALLLRWATALRATRTLPPDTPTIVQPGFYADYCFSAAAVGQLARRWRRQRAWSIDQLVQLVRGGVYCGEAPPHERLPLVPPLCHADGREEDIGWVNSSSRFARFTLEDAVKSLVLGEIDRDTGRLPSTFFTADHPSVVATSGDASQFGEDLEWVAARVLRSITEPGTDQLPHNLVDLRVRAESDWRYNWLQNGVRLAAQAATNFHQVLRITSVSAVPDPVTEEEPYRLSASLSVCFGRVSLQIRVFDTKRERRLDGGRVTALLELARNHHYSKALLADLGEEQCVALLAAYLEAGLPDASAAGKAQFLLTVLCSRIGPPSGGALGTRDGPQRRLESEDQRAVLGKIMAALPLSMSDVAAVFDTFGSYSSENPHSCGTDASPAFTAWAARADFPAAWGGAEAWKSFRGRHWCVGGIDRARAPRSFAAQLRPAGGRGVN